MMQSEVLRSGDTGCNLPVNLRRLIENAQRKFACRPHKRGATGACGPRALRPPRAPSLPACLLPTPCPPPHSLLSPSSSPLLPLCVPQPASLPPSSSPPADLDPLEVVRRVRELCDRLQVVEGQDLLSREAQRNATLLFHTLLRSTLASKRVCSEYKLTRAAWHWLTGEVETRWVGGRRGGRCVGWEGGREGGRRRGWEGKQQVGLGS